MATGQQVARVIDSQDEYYDLERMRAMKESAHEAWALDPIMERNIQNPNSTEASMRSIRQAIWFTWTYMFMVQVMVTPVAAACATLGTCQFCLNQLSYSFRTYIPQNFRWTMQSKWSWQTAY